MKINKLVALLVLSTFSYSCSQNFNSDLLNTDNNTSVLNIERNIEKPDVLEMPSPNHNERPANTVINTIVLHHTATAANARDVGKFFTNPSAKVSSHYIVDRTGYIVQPVADNLRSWHAGVSIFHGVENVNDYSIGIEICNLGDSMEPYPDAQYDGLIKLVGYLVKNYNIPLQNITRHRDISIPPGRKIDTSNNFSVDRLIKGVREVLNGSYTSPDFEEPKAIKYPKFKEILTSSSENTLEIIAEKYLDNENRWLELREVNPSLNSINGIAPGTRIRIPTGYEYFYKSLEK